MIALRMTINDEEPVVGGAEDLSVLSAAVSVTGQLGPKTVGMGEPEPHFHISLGGLTSRAEGGDEHLRWVQRWEAKAGDRIVVEVLESKSAAEPIERESAGRSATSGERALFERAKEMYFKLKEKYEPDA